MSAGILAGTGGMQADRQDRPLPPLREDLKLHPGPTSGSGMPTWTLHDPVRNRFFRIGWTEFEILSRWHYGDAERAVSEVNRDTTLHIDTNTLAALVRFLETNNLLVASGPAAISSLARQFEGARRQPAGRLLQKYLFYRIPLLRPDRFLAATLPYLEFIFTRGFFHVLMAGLVIGLFLTMRQWDSFLQTFSYLYSPAGIAWLVATLMLAKIAHELGHAYTAKRCGLNIPTIGVAFLVFWPVLYTDTTDAWKLSSRRQRLMISAAGMTAELIVAVIALLIWNILPDGPARSAVFIIATTSWILTLFVNSNPFLRFDGYHLLADYLDIPNLQSRAFSLARWRIRELIFALGDPPPGNIPQRHRRALIGYACATWAYRLLLFTGIGLLVYNLLFKLAGIVLLAAVISWFIVRPVYHELGSWMRLRPRLGWNRNTITSMVVLLTVLALLVLPWNTYISAPAIARYTGYARLFPPAPGRIQEVLASTGELVEKHQVLFRMESPELAHSRAQAQSRIEMYRLQLARQATRASTMEAIQVVQKELTKAMSEHQGYLERQQRLTITAPIPGTVVEAATALLPGRWVNESLQLALIVNRKNLAVEAYVPEHLLGRIKAQGSGVFYPENPDVAPFPVQVREISRAALTELEEPYQASIYGGEIAVRQQPDASLVPNQAIYLVRLAPENEPPVEKQLLRGDVRIQGEPRSIIKRVWQAVAAVLIRESGF